MTTRLLVFAKAPVPGQVKTRLIPAIGAEQAATLHQDLMQRTVATVCQTHLPVELWCAPDIHHPALATLIKTHALLPRTQYGPDLGTRMSHAAVTTLAGADAVILVGTDCPTLCPADIEQAQAALTKGANVVLGPAEDGGYWLLGLRRHHPELFSEIPWGSDSVLALTRERLRNLNWHWHELSVRYDVDRPEDLARWMQIQAGA
ncbi:MAG TPA: glycosyltransferase [Gammaproteobacteria bacterium]|nr:glycosyltransferase [Gammaproteobacteria bacterium]